MGLLKGSRGDGKSVQTASPLLGAVANHVAYSSGFSDRSSIQDDVNINIQLYGALMDSAATGGAGFLISPEFGLAPDGTKNRTTLAFSAEPVSTAATIGINPCKDFTSKERELMPILYHMSCNALRTNVAALVNMIDIVQCEPSAMVEGSDTAERQRRHSDCPEDGLFLFNTDVGLSAEGVFEVLYHKGHEYWGLTPQFNVPPKPDYQTWTVKGENFGIFTCFDIFWPEPAKEYVKNGIRLFMYPVQMGLIGDETVIKHWSKRENSVIFASNTCVTSKITTGCGMVFSNGSELAGEVGRAHTKDTDPPLFRIFTFHFSL
jgi:hypothetical protein